MQPNGRNPAVRIAVTRSRFRSTWPLLLVAGLFVIGAFLTWYLTWFGRELSDQEISTYLTDEQHPRKVQHALLQIQQRIDTGDTNTKQWYPQLVKLADSREPEVRLTLAWLMGADNKSVEFHQSLLKLLADTEPIVRRNAALALIRFGDPSGRNELRTVFEPFLVNARTDGVLRSNLKPGSNISRGALLARVGADEVRAPVPGTVNTVIAQSGQQVKSGDALLTLRSDEASVWEALRGLALIGTTEDVPLIQRYASETQGLSLKTKEQAALTVKAIQGRSNLNP